MEKLQIEMSEVRVRDKRVYALLFKTFFPRASFFAGQLLSDREAGADVAQETFLSIWEKGECFVNLQVFKSYLYTALKNKCLNILRDKPRTTDVEAAQGVAAEDARDRFLVMRQEIKGRIQCEIEKLPGIKRDIMMMRLEGKSFEEIANKLKISLNTVKTHKKESYKQLRIGLGGIERLMMMVVL